MNLAEAHAVEDKLRVELERRDPNNAALHLFYCSTWVAIEAYRAALFALDQRPAERR